MSDFVPSDGKGATMLDPERKTKAAGRSILLPLLPRSVQGRLLSLILVVIVPVLTLQAAMYYGRFQERYAVELQANLDLARSAAADCEAFVQDTIQHMTTLDAALSTLPPQADAKMSQLLTISANAIPAIGHFAYFDPNGRLLAPKGSNLGNVEASYRPYFEQIARGEKWVVSDLFPEPQSGKMAFVVVLGNREPSGALRSVLVAVADPDHIGDVLSARRTGKGFYSIFDRNGKGVYRYSPEGRDREDRDLTRTQPEIAGVLAGNEFAGTVVSPVDGRERIIARVPIRSIGWGVSAGRPKSEITTPIVTDLIRDVAILLLVSLVAFLSALALGYTVTIPIARLRAQALAIGRQKPVPPVDAGGLIEIEQLARAIDWMAAEIQSQRERQQQNMAEPKRAEESVGQSHSDSQLLDPLTGLPSRRLLEDAVSGSIARAHQGTASALLFLDLDNFKVVNEQIDRAAGDQALLSVATLLRQQLRTDDLVARFDGDEFAALLERVDVPKALEVAERLRQSVASANFATGDRRFILSVSIGLVPIDGKHTLEETLSQADLALRRAKDQGRNQVALRLPA